MSHEGARPELAHFYPGWIWDDQSVGQMKSLLLFFDGFALLLPEEHFNSVVTREVQLAEPLKQAGLLHNLEPRDWLDRATAAHIRRVAEYVLPDTSAAGGRYPNLGAISMGHLAFSTLVGGGSAEDADRVVERLLRSGAVTRRRPDLGADMVEMPGHVRAAVLMTLALAAQAKVSDQRIHLVGKYQQSAYASAVEHVMPRGVRKALPKARRAGEVLHRDILDVGIDLSRVPLDEVLDYKREHGAEYRKYAQDLRRFVGELEAAEPHDRQRRIDERAEMLADHASALRRARRAWGRPVAAVVLAGAGAAWTLHQANDALGAIISLVGATVGAAPPNRPESPFTYLFGVKKVA
ncbi:hypothetical protein ABZW18_33425 [Streptomyces sp. NPDC004647]|uniref:hypothetical protein n=1 Tax=Streptomyces sp. NPDC004647 TaxID=3154671 RepID=UPI0033A8D21B